jgi:hypothetical protein
MAGAALGIITFLIAGRLFLPLLGFETDELLFAQGIVAPESCVGSMSVVGHRIPLMIGSYIGGLKSWLFAPLMQMAGYTLLSVRIPVVLLCIATLILTGRLLLRISGRRAALFGIWMLSSDVTFLMTGVFDWGTVVLQNLLLAAGLALAEAWLRRRRDWLLFGSGLMFGLALWDKAIFVWNVFGMIFALAVLRRLRMVRFPVNVRAVAVLAGGMFMGGLPPVYYNFSSGLSTASQNSHFSFSDVPRKFEFLRMTLNGETTASFFADFAHPAHDKIERPLAGLASKAEAPGLRVFSSWRLALFLAIVAPGLFAARPTLRRWMLFCLLSAACAWLLSAITINAGQASHHSVLLWPFLYIALAIGADAIAGRFGRWGTPALLLVLSAFGLRGLAQITYAYSNLNTFSPMIFWTDADEPLVKYLRSSGARRVLTTDWSYDNPILIRSRGLITASGKGGAIFGNLPVADDLAPCEAPTCVLVSHVEDRQVYPHVNEKLDAVLERSGLQRRLLSRISDSHGTPTFEVFSVSVSGSDAAVISGPDPGMENPSRPKVSARRIIMNSD